MTGGKKLSQSVRPFSEILGRYTSLRRPKRLSRHRHKLTDGWYTTAAHLSAKVTIDVFLDHYLDEKELGFWVGFTSDSESEIRTLVRQRPKEMAVRETIEPPDLSELDIAVEEYFGEGYLSGFGIYFPPGAPFDMSRALAFVCDVLRTVPGFENSVKLDDVSLDIAALNSDPFLKETTREQLIQARVGQGAYRKGLESLWDNKCSVLGFTNRSVLRASHVKPWKLSNDQERLDPENGLLLTAHLDALFDAALITFSRSGEMVIAPVLSESDRQLIPLGDRLRKEPSPQLAAYLEHHRRRFEVMQGKIRPIPARVVRPA